MRDDRATLASILARIELAIRFAGPDKGSFLADLKSQSAVVRELEVIGEASKRLSPRTRQLAPSVPWKEMAGFKDVAIHQYDSIDLERVWAMVEEELPVLVPLVRRLLTRLDSSPSPPP